MKTPYDIVLLVGSGENPQSIPRIKKALEQSGLSYLILGDGQNLLTKEEIISALKDNITSDTQCHIWAHGRIYQGSHRMELIESNKESSQVFDILSSCIAPTFSKMPSNMALHVWSCHAGKAKKDTANGISLLLHSPGDQSTSVEIGIIDTIEHINFYQEMRTKYNRAPTPNESFIYSASNSPETVIFAEKNRQPIEISSPPYPMVKPTLKVYITSQFQGSSLDIPDINDASLQLFQNKNFALALARRASLQHVRNHLKYGADPNTIITPDGKTALHIAANMGDNTLTQMLLDYNADVNTVTKSGETPLSIASRQGHTTVVETLLTHGADINKPNYQGKLPLHIAASKGHTITVAKLLPYTKIDKTLPNGKTALHVACAFGYIGTAIFLTQNGADIHTIDNGGQTPLFCASKWGYTPAVNFLLNKGADPYSADNQGDLPIHVAARYNYVDTLTSLSSRMDIDTPNFYGQTALHIACQSGYIDAVRCLLANGANLQVKDDYFQTPLQVAKNHGHQAIVTLLRQQVLQEYAVRPLPKIPTKSLNVCGKYTQNYTSSVEDNQSLFVRAQ